MIEAVAALKDYDVERLDVAEELRTFKERLARLRRRPDYFAAQAVCRCSRRLLLAIIDEKWALGARSEPVRQHRAEAIAAFRRATQLRAVTLTATSSGSREKVEQFFANIAARRHDLEAGVN